jgi:hypothetical protein
VGAMSSSACEHARGQLAMAALGRLPDDERLALEAHLDGCDDCRSELGGLSGLNAALSAADPDRIDHVIEVPETLRASVLESLGTEVARHRRSARVRFASAACVVLLALGAVGVVTSGLVGSHTAPPAHTFSLSGVGSAHATIKLTSESWGTSVEVLASGQQGGQTLTVSMRTADGSWWAAGTYQSVANGKVDVTMGCALPLSSIDGVRVTNAQGQPVLSSYYES